MMPKRSTLTERVDDHSKRIERAEAALAGLVGNVNKIQTAVSGDGNGSIGMGERVRAMDKEIQALSIQLTKFMEQQKTEREAHRSERNQYKFLTYGAILSLMANIILTVWGGTP